MGAWTGWLGDMLDGLAIPYSDENRQFVRNWHLYNEYSCRNNPLLASHRATNATACHKLNDLNTAKAYATPASAVTATRLQLNSGGYPDLHDALHSGNPMAYQPFGGVTLDLQKWGSVRWSNQLVLPPGQPVSTGSGKRPHAMGAWTRWMRALGHQLPADIRAINKATARLNRIARHH